GDSILKQVASWLNGVHKTYRIAGDEFAMLFYDELNKEQVSAFVDNVLKRFSFATFFIQNEQIPVRLNIGIAIDSDKLAIQADIALHESKEKRLKYAFYEKVANIEELYRTNLMIAANVHSAIFENRLVCHYQPILDYATGRVVKYESLVRLLCTDSTVMSPMTFLHIAKKTKLYSHITQMVIEQSCKEFKDKKEEFSINISIDDILDPLTTEHIIKTITNTNTASRVVFEILESDGIQNYDTVEGFIKQVKALGAKIAIDDFGSGYSNFEHILRLDIDYIKIDGTLIKDILTKPYSQIIVGTIVDFAKKIKAKTIAEFVSSKEIFDLLKEMGVDFAQGYHIGKPKPF
ncbi:MAG: GGDEF domain-containing phosphodiesterase, partial [Sulfurimonas sp.]